MKTKSVIHNSDELYCGRYGVKQNMSFEADAVVVDLPTELLARVFIEAELLEMRREPAAKAPWGSQQMSIE